MEEELGGDEKYRLRKISARRGWAIDQIKFEYSDGRTWSVGIDGGRKDGREFVMTEGEYVVRVTHEKLYQRWYAGASVEFETNKGRVMSFHPYFATRQKDEEVTYTAGTGMEIIMLKIKHGCLEGILEQPVPEEEIQQKRKEWLVTVGSHDDIMEWGSKKGALTAWEQGKDCLLIDVLSNKILRCRGDQDTQDRCTALATSKGFYIKSTRETGSLSDILILFRKHFSMQEDGFGFLLTVFLINLGHLIGGYSEILTGHALSNFHTADPSSLTSLSLPSSLCSLAQCEDIQTSRAILILSLLVTKLASSMFDSGNIYFHSIMKESRLARMRARLFSHTLQQEMAFFDSRTVGDIQSAMNPMPIVDIIAWKVPYVMGDIFKLLVFLFYMLRININLTILTTAFFVISRIFILRPVNRKYQVLIKMEEKIRTMQNQTQNESLNLITSVKLFSREDLHLEEQRLALKKAKDIMHKKNFFRLLVIFVTNTFNVFSFCLALYCSNNFTDSLEIPAGDLTAFFLLFSQIHGLCDSIYGGYLGVLDELPVVERVEDLMNKKPQLVSGPLKVELLTGRVEFHDVCFTYPSRPGHQVIRNMSLSLTPGKVTAVVGDSGAGKSTLTSLLMRLYDPDSGSITVDGVDLKELDIPTFHRHISVVNQNPLLFNTSIGENIAYGATGREVTETEIHAAARLANAYTFIKSFRGGFDTLAGTLGTQLSGGQRQRLAIARAAIRNPRILILDEATSSLDAENEKVVTEALERIMGGRTILVIAHRLSTVRKAHEILVMRDGQIVERGTHSSLLELDGVYRHLVRGQMEGEQGDLKAL